MFHCCFGSVEKIEKTLLAADIAAGKIKIVSGLYGTRKFLKMLGNLEYTPKGNQQRKTTLEQDVTEIHEYMQTTIAKVKERRNPIPKSATNGPEGTISNKTQQSLELLKKGLCLLTDNVK